MRRQEKEIRDPVLIEEIFQQAQVCRLGFCTQGEAYIVPMSFAYSEGVLYFHSAREGRKVQLLKENPRLCFELDMDVTPIPGGTACQWSTSFRSLIGYGRTTIVEEPGAKRAALDRIMAHYGSGDFTYADASLNATLVFTLTIDEVCGKQRLQPAAEPATDADELV